MSASSSLGTGSTSVTLPSSIGNPSAAHGEATVEELFLAADKLSQQHHNAPTVPGEPYDTSHLQHDAQLMGLQFSTHPVLAALTVSPPSAFRSDGFLPDWQQPPGNLYAHMLSGGGANLVCLRWFPLSPHACLALAEAATPLYSDCARFIAVHFKNTHDAMNSLGSQNRDQFLIRAVADINRSVRQFFPDIHSSVTVFEVYCNDVGGVHVDKSFPEYPLCAHDEVWCPSVLPQQAFAFRSVRIDARWEGLDVQSLRPQIAALTITAGPVAGLEGHPLSEVQCALLNTFDARSQILQAIGFTPEELPRLSARRIEEISTLLADRLMADPVSHH